jgi:hypothetical protein
MYIFKANGDRKALHEYFIVDPVIVRYSDGTYSYNAIISQYHECRRVSKRQD